LKLNFATLSKIFGIVASDSLLGGICAYLAVSWRYDFLNIPVPKHSAMHAALATVIAVVIIWTLLGVHRAVWRFTSVPDIRKLLIGSLLAIPLAVIFLFYFDDRAHDYPRIAALITLGLFFVILSVSRLLVMITKTGDINGFLQTSSRNNADAFLIGSAKSLQDYIRDNVRDKNGLRYNVLGLIELEDDYQGRSIRGFSVVGNLNRLDKVYARYKKDKNHYPALVCVDANRIQKSRLLKIASEIGAPLLQINRNKGTALSPFEVSDLIGRPIQDQNIDFVSRQIKGRRVLITGAGGSIGSEIARQIYRLNPSEIILVDNSEYNLYQVNRSLMNEFADEVKCNLQLVDVCDEKTMEIAFERLKPEVVFHAAAFKHVPMGESNPIEMLKNNVIGTKNIVKLALKYKIKSLTFISTDKAVDPCNIMGASKRIGEMIIRAAATEAKISICAVRFGNVLDSAGSVLPLFEEQIAMGGPITVTHSDVERYFMTAEEASRLVLQATALNENQIRREASIYILEMGNPVKISHLARQLIRLRGLVPDRDIKIKYTGLRLGEKITETLMNHEESLESTYINGIKRLTEEMYTPDDMRDRVRKLIKALNEHDEVKVKAALFDLLPEFIPNGSLS
jgi:O-antigen biosynthesis protein WbqV